MTPEGKVKSDLKKSLNRYSQLYQFWPVQNGMGSPALDVIVCFKGRYISIEVKALRHSMTPRQEVTADRIRIAGGDAFLINEDPETWKKLKHRLDEIDASS